MLHPNFLMLALEKHGVATEVAGFGETKKLGWHKHYDHELLEHPSMQFELRIMASEAVCRDAPPSRLTVSQMTLRLLRIATTERRSTLEEIPLTS